MAMVRPWYVQSPHWDFTLDLCRISDGKALQGIHGLLSKYVSGPLLRALLILIMTYLIHSSGYYTHDYFQT